MKKKKLKKKYKKLRSKYDELKEQYEILDDRYFIDVLCNYEGRESTKWRKG